MPLFFWIIAFVFLFAVLQLFFVWYFRKRRRFPEKLRDQIRAHLAKIETVSPREQILEYDKVLDLCLRQRGYSGTLGEKMQKHGQNFLDVSAIWRAHKLRNRIAHELDFTPETGETAGAVRTFRKEIESFLR